MKGKPILLPLVVAVSLSAIYFLPSAGETAQSAARMELPGTTAGWSLENLPASKEEIATLGKETDFSKARCLKPRPGEFTVDGLRIPDLIDLSIVLSGSDLNTSIHRPERCMPAQGHVITGSRAVSFELENGRNFDARRLRSVRKLSSPDGSETAEFHYLTYYFFVGHDRITNDHIERTLIDMKDRLFRGMDQRWAYVSATMMYGQVPWIDEEVSEEEADEKLLRFVKDFAARQIVWDQVAE